MRMHKSIHVLPQRTNQILTPESNHRSNNSIPNQPEGYVSRTSFTNKMGYPHSRTKYVLTREPLALMSFSTLEHVEIL